MGEYHLLVFAVIALYLDELRCQALSLHQIELACTEPRAVVGLLADTAAVAQVESLHGLVSARNLGELALISNTIGSQISLSSNMGQGGFPALSHTLHSLRGVLFAERTVSVKLFRHLHNTSSLKLHVGRLIRAIDILAGIIFEQSDIAFGLATVRTSNQRNLRHVVARPQALSFLCYIFFACLSI